MELVSYGGARRFHNFYSNLISVRLGLGISRRIQLPAGSLHATAARDPPRVPARAQHVPAVAGRCGAVGLHRNVLRRPHRQRERRLRECDDVRLPFLLEGNAVRR